ncbi:hypothetical protein HMPREF9078_01566 [Capnocytophaga sp. oral taxon 380 str. F0488]|nr:hypothetical protein HMPREF9078_01566 [Capnocytophaga sp. oral taxon 380 str. F0488]
MFNTLVLPVSLILQLKELFSPLTHFPILSFPNLLISPLVAFPSLHSPFEGSQRGLTAGYVTRECFFSKCKTKIRKPILISYNKKTLCQKVS